MAGILLFLPVPVVLALFTRQPFGTAASVIAGAFLMLTHRFYARPWAVARAGRRCLWCARAHDGGVPLDVREPGTGAAPWTACRESHADAARRFVGWGARHALLLRVGILGGLLAFAAGTVLGVRGLLGASATDDAVDVFRLAVAVAVLPLGWLAGRRPAQGGPVRSPFPLHVQALVGTVAVMWLFRLIGAWWLVASVAGLVRRHAGGAS